MRLARIAVILAFSVIAAACNRDSSDQYRAETKAKMEGLESRLEDIKPGLGEIMGVIQQHHAKLYFSGMSENWELADYQLGEIQEGLENAAKFYPKFKEVKAPISQLIPAMMKGGLDGVAAAIKGKNKAEFQKNFQALTASCNRCHQAAEHPFIVIQVPSHTEFTNQRFTK